MKPSLDLLLFTSQLSRSLGFRGTFLLFGNYYITMKVCRDSMSSHMVLFNGFPRFYKLSRPHLVVLLLSRRV